MNSEKLEQVWSEVCGQVKSYNNIDPSQINAFFSRLHPQAMSDGVPHDHRGQRLYKDMGSSVIMSSSSNAR